MKQAVLYDVNFFQILVAIILDTQGLLSSEQIIDDNNKALRFHP